MGGKYIFLEKNIQLRVARKLKMFHQFPKEYIYIFFGDDEMRKYTSVTTTFVVCCGKKKLISFSSEEIKILYC